MHFYVILSQAFCEENNGYIKDNLVFYYSLTNEGVYVCSVNCLNEFQELFIGVNFEIISLDRGAFPDSLIKTPSPIEG